MIRSLTSGEKPDFDGALNVRIGSFFNSYGVGYDFARFWVQYNGCEQTSLLFLMDGCLTVICKTEADEELISFISALCIKSVLSNVNLPLPNEQRISVYRKGFSIDKAKAESVDYKEVYSRFSQSFTMPQFDAWYVDICHRVRHFGAVLCLDEYAAACAAVNNSEGLITGISVKDEFRRMGHGRRTIERISALSGCSTMYVMCDCSDNERFYSSCGFTYSNDVYQYIIGD